MGFKNAQQAEEKLEYITHMVEKLSFQSSMSTAVSSPTGAHDAQMIRQSLETIDFLHPSHVLT